MQAVRLAAAGKPYLNPQLGVRIAVEPPAADDDLSDLELQILHAVALGRRNHEIASQLYLSVRSVETHRQRMQQKLGLTRVSEPVRYALTRGLLDDD